MGPKCSIQQKGLLRKNNKKKSLGKETRCKTTKYYKAKTVKEETGGEALIAAHLKTIKGRADNETHVSHMSRNKREARFQYETRNTRHDIVKK